MPRVPMDPAHTWCNLMHVDGDLTPMLEVAAAGGVKFFVVTNHKLEPDEVQKTRELPMDERVAVILADDGCKVNPRYGKDPFYCAVYAVGQNLQALIKPIAAPEKRMRVGQ